MAYEFQLDHWSFVEWSRDLDWIVSFRGGKTHMFHWLVWITLANDVKNGSARKEKPFLRWSCCPWKLFVCVIGRYSSELAELVPLLHSCVWYTHCPKRFNDFTMSPICRCHNDACASSFFLYAPKLLQCLSLSFDLWSKLFQISILRLCDLLNKLSVSFD